MSTRVVTRKRLPSGRGRLYDKMRLFVDDMSAIGQSLDKAQESYRQAMKKLASGVVICWPRRRPFAAWAWRSSAGLILI
ncbi:DNA recombination protein rmuC [Serratia liquefaciens]|nr:DNA recombination protein rmuC [Serratia liquefaciens]